MFEPDEIKVRKKRVSQLEPCLQGLEHSDYIT